MKVGERYGPYTVVAHVTDGALGRTFKARDDEGQVFSLVHLTENDPLVRKAVKRTVSRVQELWHPGIVRVVETFDVERKLCLVCEWVPGRSLDQFMGQPWPLKYVVQLCKQIAKGLIAIHAAELVHRNLKPELIIVDEKRGPVITDFMLAKIRAKALSGKSLSAGFSILGTPEYMAPEQVRFVGKVDQRADIFSLGAIIYELVTGELAFDSEDEEEAFSRVSNGLYEPPTSHRPDLPIEWVHFIRDLLQVDRDERIPDAQTVLERLRALPI